MKGIVLTSHGPLAAAMKESLALFVGEAEQLEAICLAPGQALPDFLEALQMAIHRVDTGEGVIVFCDLLFGTPCNASASLLQNESLAAKLEVITGMNLPMVLEVLSARPEGMQKADMLQVGRDAIVDFKALYEERKQKAM